MNSADTYFVVDDSNFARKVIKRVLDKLGCTMIGEANNGSTAISGLKTLEAEGKAPTFITLDIAMPDVTGDEIVPLIREIFPGSKIIMTTSIADKSTVQRCLQAGVKGYILKPVTEEKVLEAINIITINDLLKKKGMDPDAKPNI
jgi:two-component system chemotaxis response regulator CheY